MADYLVEDMEHLAQLRASNCTFKRRISDDDLVGDITWLDCDVDSFVYSSLQEIIKRQTLKVAPRTIKVMEFYEDGDTSKTVWYPAWRTEIGFFYDSRKITATGRAMDVTEYDEGNGDDG